MRRAPSHFAWPQSRFDIKALFNGERAKASDVERSLAARFAGTHPVLVSSGRSAIVLTLQALGLWRPDNVGIAPFSSTCIFQTVGDVATPVPGNLPASFAAHLVYHQWGYVHRVKTAAPVIEDAVDSLHVSAAALFPNGGRVEIVSLCKLFGVPFGGVIFARSEDEALALRELRERRRYMAWPQLLMRCLGERRESARLLWNNGEAANGPVPDAMCGVFMRHLDRFDALVADRRAKLALVRDLAPAWLRFSDVRLPCVVPIECGDDLAARLLGLGFTGGLRHFNTTQDQLDWKLTKVFPLPIHQDVPMSLLAEAADVIRRSR
jgi:putative PLP-dependent aminotransferase (TIGR04422 family)